MREKLVSAFFRIWYWYVSTADKNSEVIFMNYGYSKDGHRINLDAKDEANRYSAQLYDHVATGVDVKGKSILEIGCGRGGGLSYINRYLSPKSVTGLDLCDKAIDFCSKYYSKEGIAFLQGNAESLAFQDHTFDVVINIESSHRYSRIDKFLSEVYRVLRPGGFFLFSDFRHKNELEELNNKLEAANLKFIKAEMISTSVVEALKLSSSEREYLIKKLAPRFLHRLGKQFAATEGTPTFNKFATNEYEYFFYILVAG